jgi:hypothetical protein
MLREKTANLAEKWHGKYNHRETTIISMQMRYRIQGRDCRNPGVRDEYPILHIPGCKSVPGKSSNITNDPNCALSKMFKRNARCIRGVLTQTPS